MNDRLLSLVRYKTGGRQNKFADLIGWTPQYLAKLLRGEGFGLQPVLTLLEKLPEVNARWLLLGEGSMLVDDKVMGLRRDVYSRVQRILDFDKYIPVMSADEMRQFEALASGGAYPDYSDDDVARWESLLAERQSAIDEKFNDAMSKATAPCRPPKASKS